VVKAVRYKPAGHGFDFRWCNWIFFHYGPGVNSASNRNEYKVCLLVVNATGV
jgi:hypothetical protein